MLVRKVLTVLLRSSAGLRKNFHLLREIPDFGRSRKCLTKNRQKKNKNGVTL